MAVEITTNIEGKEEKELIVTMTTVEEKMTPEKFLATYAQKEGEKKSIEQNLKVLNEMLADLQTLKTTRDMKVVRTLLDKLVRPEQLETQKETLTRQLEQVENIIKNLKPLFDKTKDAAKAKAAAEETSEEKKE